MSINTQKSSVCIEINPQSAAKSAIIWLHGLGADGNDFVPIARELQLPKTLGLRFIFPHAPIIPVTINSGYEMRAWFDIYDASITTKIDEEGIAHSVKALEYLIAHEEQRGIPINRIILAGFSQGAVIALTTGLTFSKPLAGILALSGFLPLAENVLHRAAAANSTIPIFMAHGTQDTILPYHLGEKTADLLTQAGYPVTFRNYPMTHAVCPEEIADIKQWICQVLT